MSRQLINQYYNQLANLIRHGGARNEMSIRRAFETLLNSYADRRGLLLVPELKVLGTKGRDVTPDGVLKNAMRLDFGLWESKDEKDDIDKEIQAKINKGYPLTNILFEDTQTAVLYQDNQQVMRAPMDDEAKLDEILNRFISFEPPQVKDFIRAIQQFKEDIPDIVQSLRELMDNEAQKNKDYREARDLFFELCKAEINPDIAPEDIREMMIQHILTADIFNSVFDGSNFHRSNNIARELERVIDTFMTIPVRQNYLANIRHYYQTIRENASRMADHHEKQGFLKTVYEDFYKVYNPKGADKLGVVYTPNEIVRFMIESTDYLLEKHFGKNLHDKNVEILDPATGTGTFITTLIDSIAPKYLKHKYLNEIHANEVAILPYYIANLNIEYTYQQRMKTYEEFQNICFVDTLDNTDALAYEAQNLALNFGLSHENSERIRRQNERKISVVIGNPPYNANQMNFNEFNKNRDYNYIDKRIKDTFVYHSTAQKTKVYDMYARFYAWAMERVDKNGIIAFITNRSFIDSRTYDGFRKVVADSFDFAYIVDTRSDVRVNPKIAGTTHNVFGIQTGVAIMFLVRKAETKKKSCKIDYAEMDDFWRKDVKLQWLSDNPLKSISFRKITPDIKNNWLNLADTNFEDLIPLADKEVKLGHKREGAVFQLFSLGVATNRDEWLYDVDKDNLRRKIQFFSDHYKKAKKEFWRLKNKDEFRDITIKFTSEILDHFVKNSELDFDEANFKEALFRPYIKEWTYFDRIITHRLYKQNSFYPIGTDWDNKVICFSGPSSSKNFQVLSCSKLVSLDFLEKTQTVALYTYDSEGNRHDNITDWGLEQFRENYNDKKIGKEDIFHYVYGVLHDPAYREKYELNLKRDFPRVPFYKDFWQWAKWGAELMKLHIGYETVEPYPLQEKNVGAALVAARAKETGRDKPRPYDVPKTKLRADKENGTIELDAETSLHGIPSPAWEYKLGNRSALEWILDQYKEKKPSDPTIAEKFNTYRFADHKDQLTDLLKRVCTVSVETMKIVEAMKVAGKYLK